MFREAFDYPLAGESRERLLVGGLLTLGGVIVFLPAIPLQGYFVAVIRSVVAEEADPPAFEDWEALSLDGLKALLVAVPYAIVATVVVAFAVFVLTAGLVAFRTRGGDPTSLAILGIAGLLTLVAAVVFTAATYLYPIALAHFAVEDSVEAAFDLRTVAAIAWNREYAVAWLFVSTVGFVLAAVAGALSLVLVGFFATFYLQVAFVALFARGYERGRESAESRLSDSVHAESSDL
ncbi:DUF4013 domain-containing protein [Haloarculaceae archaeon H-GB2-1]|nr:DUF4013 domain-containing protein [Haloarculaceae archaeon H-GB1-1]MEA5385855.1 DUF4013 domain-containing protein [Haloarculaceae archaeon H-GB11]MEA5407359.1 DUF4013 domain-containing protein [Haloarculaceae archaeon H-GB2-1]